MELKQQTSLIEQAKIETSRWFWFAVGEFIFFMILIIPLTWHYINVIQNTDKTPVEIVYVNPAGDFIKLNQGNVAESESIRHVITKYITMQRTIIKDYQFSMKQVWNSRYLLTQNASQCLNLDPYNPDQQINKTNETTRLWKQGIRVDVDRVSVMATDEDFRYLVRWIEKRSNKKIAWTEDKEGFFKVARIKPTVRTIRNGNLTEWAIDYYSINNEIQNQISAR